MAFNKNETHQLFLFFVFIGELFGSFEHFVDFVARKTILIGLNRDRLFTSGS